MTEKKVLTDGNHVIELYHLQNSLHNDGLIVAYLPKEKILVEADAFTPRHRPMRRRRIRHRRTTRIWWKTSSG